MQGPGPYSTKHLKFTDFQPYCLYTPRPPKLLPIITLEGSTSGFQGNSGALTTNLKIGKSQMHSIVYPRSIMSSDTLDIYYQEIQGGGVSSPIGFMSELSCS